MIQPSLHKIDPPAITHQYTSPIQLAGGTAGGSVELSVIPGQIVIADLIISIFEIVQIADLTVSPSFHL